MGKGKNRAPFFPATPDRHFLVNLTAFRPRLAGEVDLEQTFLLVLGVR